MKSYKFMIGIALLIATITSCNAVIGEEIGRVSIAEISTLQNPKTAEITFNIEKGETITIWSSMDYSYMGNSFMVFTVDAFLEDIPVATFFIDPEKANLYIKAVKSSSKGVTSRRFKAARGAKFLIEESGTYTFKAALVDQGTKDLQVYRSELFITK